MKPQETIERAARRSDRAAIEALTAAAQLKALAHIYHNECPESENRSAHILRVCTEAGHKQAEALFLSQHMIRVVLHNTFDKQK